MTKLFKRIRALVKENRGFTLIEMMTVMGILSVLSAITFPAVTGTTSFSRATTQTVDLTAAQQAVDRFDIDTNSSFPTLASLSGTVGAWQAGQLPEAAPTGGDGSSANQAKVFTQESIAGFDFGAFDCGSENGGRHVIGPVVLQCAAFRFAAGGARRRDDVDIVHSHAVFLREV